MLVIGAAIAAVVLVIVLTVLVYVTNLKKVPPNKVGIFTGGGKESTYVRGASKFRVPGIVQYDEMLLEPIQVDIKLRDSLSKEGVPINVDAVGLVRFGTTDEMLRTSVQRFLSSNQAELKNQINEILSGSLRGVVAKMTPEEINSDRDGLRKNVVDDSGESLKNIGMEVDVLTISAISDGGGYLTSLGEKRTAEVKKDAAIAKADAERETRVRSAQAKQAGDVAQALADTAIAQANEARDTELANIRSRVDAENSRAAQAGPLADQQARKAVVVAEQEAEAAREEAKVRTEEMRAKRAEAALQADVIAPAQAKRQADIEAAEGRKQAAILDAQAEAEKRRQEGEAEADARKAAAAAMQAELEAEAAGTEKKAAALNSFSATAIQLELQPLALNAVVKATEAAVKPIGEIDKLTILGNSSDASEAIGILQGIGPNALARVVAVLEDSGVNLSALKDIAIQKAQATIEPASIEQPVS